MAVWTRRTISHSEGMPYRKPANRYFTMTTGRRADGRIFDCKTGLFSHTGTTDPVPPPTSAGSAPATLDSQSLPLHRQLHPITSGRFPHYSISRGLLGDFVNSANLARSHQSQAKVKFHSPLCFFILDNFSQDFPTNCREVDCRTSQENQQKLVQHKGFYSDIIRHLEMLFLQRRSRTKGPRDLRQYPPPV